MSFDRDLYAEAWRVLRVLWPYALLVVFCAYALEAAYSAVSQDTGWVDIIVVVIATLLNIVALVSWSVLAYMAHAEVLLPAARARRIEPHRILGFAWRFFALTLLAVLFTLALGLVVTGAVAGALHGLGWADFSTLGTINQRTLPVFTAVFVFIPLETLGLLLPFFFIGTAFAAYVADDGRGIERAWRRTRRQFSWMATRFVLGPGLVAASAAAVLELSARAAGWTGETALMYGSAYPVLNLVALADLLCRIYAAVMLAVLLSRAFLRDTATTGQPEPPADPNADDGRGPAQA